MSNVRRAKYSAISLNARLACGCIAFIFVAILAAMTKLESFSTIAITIQYGLLYRSSKMKNVGIAQKKKIKYRGKTLGT